MMAKKAAKSTAKKSERSKSEKRSGPAKPSKAAMATVRHRGRKPQGPPTNLTGYKARIYQLLTEKRISMRELSLASGLNASTVRNILYTDREVTAGTALALADSLNVSLGWLLTGMGTMSDERREVQMVPLLSPGQIDNYINDKDTEAMRYIASTPLTPPERRFFLEFHGNSMMPLVRDGDLIDCSAAIRATPDDVVLVWKRSHAEYVVRRIRPSRVDESDGEIVEGQLLALGDGWGATQFSFDDGDRIVAVVLETRRQFRRSI